MRILWLAAAATVGGADVALAEGVAALSARGHDVHVVLPREGPLQHLLPAAASLHRLHSNPWLARVRPALPLRARQALYNLLKAAPHLATLARELRVEVVLTNTIEMPAGALAARRARLPHVWYLHEYGDLDHGRAFHWGRRPTLFAVSRWSRLVLVNSEALRRHCERFVAPAKLRIVRYSVEVDLPPPPPPAGPFRLVLLGHKAAGKGQLDAVRALSALRRRGVRVELDLVGGADPVYDEALRAEARALGVDDAVRHLGFDPGRLQLFAQADAALMCSRAEAFGRVTAEAMKLGRPVIGARAGATPELIREGETGLLYSPGHPEELAACIEALHHDRARARAMGERALAWARQEFTAERYGQALESALCEAVGAG